MFYVERDAQGRVRSLEKWSTKDSSGERLKNDDPEILAFRNRQQTGVVLCAPEFVLVLAMLKIEPDVFAATIEAIPDLTSLQKTYHAARFWRGDRYQLGDPILVSVLAELGVTQEALNDAWTAARDMAESEAS